MNDHNNHRQPDVSDLCNTVRVEALQLPSKRDRKESADYEIDYQNMVIVIKKPNAKIQVVDTVGFCYAHNNNNNKSFFHFAHSCFVEFTMIIPPATILVRQNFILREK